MTLGLAFPKDRRPASGRTELDRTLCDPMRVGSTFSALTQGRSDPGLPCATRKGSSRRTRNAQSFNLLSRPFNLSTFQPFNLLLLFVLFLAPFTQAALPAPETIRHSPAAPAARPLPGGALALDCPFSQVAERRLWWDFPCQLDLSEARGLRLFFRCADASPAAYLSVYFQSQNGWYGIDLSPKSSDAVGSIDLDKALSTIDGKVGGWASISKIRVAVWRGEARDCSFEVHGLLPLAPEEAIPVLRSTGLAAGQMPLPAEESRVSASSAASICRDLAKVSCAPFLLDDLDIARLDSRRHRLLVLPYNPQLPPPVLEAVLRFQREGGLVLSFYLLPKALGEVQGFRTLGLLRGKDLPLGLGGFRLETEALPTHVRTLTQRSSLAAIGQASGEARVAATWCDLRGQSLEHPALLVSPGGAWMTHIYLGQDSRGPDFLLGLLSRFAPEAQARAASRRLDALGQRLGYPDLAAAHAELARLCQGPEAAVSLEHALLLEKRARSHLAAGRYQHAHAAAAECRQALEKAWCLSRKAVPGEFRGLWIHDGSGLAGSSWQQIADKARRSGFSDLLVNLAAGPEAWFKAGGLLLHPEARQNDQLAAARDACRKEGLKLHCWITCFELRRCKDAAFVAHLKETGRLLVRRDGRIDAGWLCPSQNVNRSLVLDAARAAAAAGVDGVHLDYIRHQGPDACFCPSCRAAFAAREGKVLPDLPKSLAADPELLKRWNQQRRDLITSLVRDVRKVLRSTPGVQLSAAVFDQPENMRDTIAQDWPLWAKEGLVDFLCPMNYMDSPEAFSSTVIRQQHIVAGTSCKLHPGIGASTRSLDPIIVIAQIEAARRQGCPGFTLFSLTTHTEKHLFPLLGLGVTRPPGPPRALPMPCPDPAWE
ncbi:MAG: hypothetical protein RL095_2118 [Verrucomicrobiota bacterium]|jgi:uncharacterized lipoprotein YddW (UPF0748 family)